MKSGAILPKKVFDLKIALIGHVTICGPKKTFKVLQLSPRKCILSLLRFMFNSSKDRPPPYFFVKSLEDPCLNCLENLTVFTATG